MKRIATYDNRYKQAVETRRMILIVLLALGCVLLLPRLLAQRMQKELLWRPVEGAPRWSVYITRQKTPSGGALADTLLDELQRQVLDGLSEE